MKNLLYILSGLLILLLVSCSDDTMDRINENPNNPTDMPSYLIITDVMVKSGFSVASGDLAFYASLYAEHNVGCYGQFYNAEIRTTEPVSASTYNNSWNAAYNNLFNLKVITERCSEGGAEEGNWHTLGIAQILTAYNLATLTDVMGDVPWTEALQPGVVFTPTLDSQKDIYSDIIKLLTDAVTNLKKETLYGDLGNQDVFYGGDEKLWLKFANGLLARYTLRQSAVTANYSQVVDYAEESFAKAADECKLDYESIAGRSPFFAIFEDRNYYAASQSLHDKLVSMNDPRDSYFWKAHPESSSDDIVFALNGDPNRDQQVQDKFSVSALSHNEAPSFLMSYHELEFVKAEALARNGSIEGAKTALKNGVVAAFLKIAFAIDESNDDIIEMAETYFDNIVTPRFDANPVKEIVLQKYIACFEEESLEAYADIRRLKAMGGDNANIIELKHPEASKFPLRYTYGNSDVTTNVNVRNAYESVNVFTDNVWWAGGNK
jgi:hypothetical protein